MKNTALNDSNCFIGLQKRLIFGFMDGLCIDIKDTLWFAGVKVMEA